MVKWFGTHKRPFILSCFADLAQSCHSEKVSLIRGGILRKALSCLATGHAHWARKLVSGVWLEEKKRSSKSKLSASLVHHQLWTGREVENLKYFRKFMIGLETIQVKKFSFEIRTIRFGLLSINLALEILNPFFLVLSLWTLSFNGNALFLFFCFKKKNKS